jgi:predicted nucleic acid-binding protein
VRKHYLGAREQRKKAMRDFVGIRRKRSEPLDAVEQVRTLRRLYLHRFRRSHGVEIADALIAAASVANNAKLWTQNRKRYPMAGISFFE